jgi:hypothetical protein
MGSTRQISGLRAAPEESAVPCPVGDLISRMAKKYKTPDPRKVNVGGELPLTSIDVSISHDVTKAHVSTQIANRRTSQNDLIILPIPR